VIWLLLGVIGYVAVVLLIAQFCGTNDLED
jgi:hypothetical protein